MAERAAFKIANRDASSHTTSALVIKSRLVPVASPRSNTCRYIATKSMGEMMGGADPSGMVREIGASFDRIG